MAGVAVAAKHSGRGSVFSFTVPLQIDVTRADEAPLPVKSNATADRARRPARRNPRRGRSFTCCLAEDTPTNQVLVVHALGKRGHQVTIAGDGRTAVDLAERGSYD